MQPGECALPVHQLDGQTTHTGWLLYPDGGLQHPSSFSGGQNGGTYDAIVGRWLPVAPTAVSPDGLSFAYAEYDLPASPAAGMAGAARPHDAGTLATTGRVELVDAQTGRITILYSGSPTYAIAGFTNDGIYLTQVSITMDGDFSSGLYRISPTGGTPVAVTGGNRALDRLGWTVQDGAAWGVDFSGGGGITEGNELVRLNLASGALTVMLTKAPGVAVGMLGVDGSGNVLAALTSNGLSTSDSTPAAFPPQLVAITTPQASVVLWQGSTADSPPWGPVFNDSHGAWLSGEASLWLIDGQTVSRVPAEPSNPVFVGDSCLSGG